MSSARGCSRTCRRRCPPPSSTATTASATCSSRRTRRADQRRARLGAVRRSAIRSPTSATCCRCTPTTRSRAPGYPALSPVTRGAGLPDAGRARAAVRGAAPAATRRASPGTSASAHWKAAVFLENMWKRFLAGDRDDDFARSMEQGVPAKLAAAEAAAARDAAPRALSVARTRPGCSSWSRWRRSARSCRARPGSATGSWWRPRCSRRSSRGRRSSRRSAPRSS